MSETLVLDAGALIAIERRSTRIQALVQRARTRNISIVIPAAAVAQVVRSGGRQAGLRRFISDAALRFVSLDYATALEIGKLLGETATIDVVDAAVVICAQRMDLCPVVTSDPDDIHTLDPRLSLIAV